MISIGLECMTGCEGVIVLVDDAIVTTVMNIEKIMIMFTPGSKNNFEIIIFK